VTIRWTRDATRQLAAAYDYIAAENSKAADQVLERILHSIRQLADFPESGRLGLSDPSSVSLAFPLIRKTLIHPNQRNQRRSSGIRLKQADNPLSN